MKKQINTSKIDIEFVNRINQPFQIKKSLINHNLLDDLGLEIILKTNKYTYVAIKEYFNLIKV